VRLITPLFMLVSAVKTSAAQSSWVTPDTAARTVTLDLAVTPKADAPSARIAGFREGGAQVVVPLGWTVRWSWHSEDPGAQHSLVVMQEREKLPTEGGRPAFTNAMSREVVAGLKAGEKDQTTFVADQAGWYWLLCGVPGHALAGEWIGLKVDPEATTASVKTK
jgi:uncharacterized cupredoxin-like copper-binding protein